MEGTSPLDKLEVQRSGLSHTLNYTEEASRRGYKKGLDGKITQSKIIKLEVAFSIIKYPEHKFSFSLGYILRNQESQVTLIIITIFFFFLAEEKEVNRQEEVCQKQETKNYHMLIMIQRQHRWASHGFPHGLLQFLLAREVYLQ